MVERQKKPRLMEKTVNTSASKSDKQIAPVKAAAVKPAVRKEQPKEKKPGIILRWWRETLGELRKVTWPTPEEAWKLTRVVIVVMLIMSTILGIFDFILSRAMTALLSI